MNLSARAYAANVLTGAVSGLIAGAVTKTQNYAAWAAAGAGAGLAMTLTADLVDTAGDENKAKVIAAYDRAKDEPAQKAFVVEAERLQPAEPPK